MCPHASNLFSRHENSQQGSRNTVNLTTATRTTAILDKCHGQLPTGKLPPKKY